MLKVSTLPERETFPDLTDFLDTFSDGNTTKESTSKRSAISNL